MWISPSFQDDHFPRPWTLDAKIALFADRVRGWQIMVAQNVASTVPNSDFAVLAILMSYFEMYAKYETGFVPSGKREPSKEYSILGIRAVLGEFLPRPRGDQTVERAAAERLYERVRCGLYHGGLPRGDGGGVWLHPLPDGSPIKWVNDGIVTKPSDLVEHVRVHFGRYVARLLDSAEEELRRAFEARFDFDNGLIDQLDDVR